MTDYHSTWNHRWKTNKVKSYKSPIHGLGVIATEPINKGETIFVYGGVIVPRLEIQNYWTKMGHVGIQIDDNFWICPTSRKELENQGVINHSCEPNTGFQNQVILQAIKDIKPNEEITFDYAFSETFMETFECKCGSKNCRKIITQDDWQRPEIRNKYRNYFSPYLLIKEGFKNL